MSNIPHDSQAEQRWWYLLPSGLFRRIPPEVSPENRVAWGRDQGAMVIRRENEVVWRRAQDPSCRPVRSGPPQIPSPRRRGHLTVVK